MKTITINQFFKDFPIKKKEVARLSEIEETIFCKKLAGKSLRFTPKELTRVNSILRQLAYDLSNVEIY